MKKTVLGIALALLVAATLLTGALAADDVTVISSPDELIAFRNSVNNGNDYAGRKVVLGDNIDLSLQGINWTPIGTGTRSGSGYTGKAFKGTFDGRGFTISGLTIDATVSGDNVDDAYGLFGVIDGATVTNLTLANVHITVNGGECVGGVVGLMVNGSTVSNIEMDVGSGITAVRGLGGIVGRMTIRGTIENCVNEASINGSGANVGGIVGAAYYTAVGAEMYITNCKNYGAVTCTAGVAGGIAGLSAANVSGCENHAVITGNGTDVAGIVAEQQNAGSVTNCVNYADITNNSGAYGTGGIVGWVRYNGSTTNYPRYGVVEICGNVNYGIISGGNDGGGIVGTVYNAAVVTGNENYAESISGETFAAGIVGNLQFTETPLGDIPAKDVSISNNISTTPLENIDAGCKGEYAYDNEGGKNPNVVVTENSAAWAAQIGAQKYATLAGAMDAAVEAGSATIELLGDITVTETVVLDSADANITLDLCDHKITGENCRVLWIKSGSMAIVSTGGLGGVITTVAAETDPINPASSVIRVGSDDGEGTEAALTVGTYGAWLDVSIIAPDTYGISVFGEKTYETLTVYGDVSATGPKAAIAGSGNDVNTPTNITIDGGSGSASASAENYYAIYHPQEGKLTVRNCNIEGRGGIQMCAGELVIKEKTGIYAQNIGAHGTIDGADGAIIDGAAVSLVKRSGYGDGSGPSVRIEGGSFHSEDGTPIKLYSWDGTEEQPWDEAPTGFISGGKFSNAVEPAWLAPGLVYQLCVTDPLDEDSEREYSYYSSLEAALENVKEDWVITQVGSTGSVYTVKIDRADGSEPVSYKLGAGIELTLPTLNKPGYIFMGWKCSDGHTYQAGEVITVEKDMTFTAIWSNLPDIEPGEPDEPDVPDFPFTDVSVNAWYYEAVKYVYENGIMNGMDRYSFQPNGTLTRAMVWTMLARLDGVDTEGGNSWYAKAQEWATANSVSDGENPTGEVTREQLITMLWRYAGSPTYTADLSGYVDTADISSWAQQAMCWAVATGVIEGDENAALTPKASTTRAQAAAMFMRAVEL